MIDIFDDMEIDLTKIICHSGGADGADTFWEKMGAKVGVKTRAYSYKTPRHQSINKVEISEADFKEGIVQVNRANHWLNRYGINKYINLLARNWCQVKYSKQVIAIGTIVNPGEKTTKGYRCNSKYQSVDGGTGYAVQMAIDNLKDVWVFDQVKEKWFRWSYSSMSFVQSNCPKIQVQNFAGIGTREINPSGINAIKDVYKKTFNL
jgi:hypothetical protein